MSAQMGKVEGGGGAGKDRRGVVMFDPREGERGGLMSTRILISGGGGGMSDRMLVSGRER